MKALVLLSGGMDSCTVASLAAKEHGPGNVMALSFKYPSRHNERELEAAEAISNSLFLELHEILELANVFKGAKSSLLKSGQLEMPHKTYQELAETEGPSPTVVPFRNGVMLSMAVAIAASRDIPNVYIAVHGEDAHNFAYPDTTPEFIGAFTAAAYIGTYHQVHIIAPFQWMTKAQALATGLGMDPRPPYNLTWSCYDPVLVDEADPSVGLREFWIACGKCPTCSERIEAFKTNGIVDPIDYAIGIDWRE